MRISGVPDRLYPSRVPLYLPKGRKVLQETVSRSLGYPGGWIGRRSGTEGTIDLP